METASKRPRRKFLNALLLLLPSLVLIALYLSLPATGSDPFNLREVVEIRPEPFSEQTEERLAMVDDQLNSITDERVLEAMRIVPRHAFVPPGYRQYAYDNGPLPIGLGQTISQPFIVAFMSETAQIEPGERVLEIGTGSGYQAAVLAEMGAEVYTIELRGDLAYRAWLTLAELRYDSIHTRVGDGYAGWPEMAPFDAIIVTAAPPAVPQTLLDQLAENGVLVAPIGEQYTVQQLTRFTKDSTGSIIEEPMLAVRFVPMVHEGK